ncbi:MAG: ROK family protein, partial [Microbacterium sp.]
MGESMGGGLSAVDVRSHNLGLVLTCVDRAGRIARTELAAATGLAPGAITLLISELSEAGFVRDAAIGPARPGARGRPPRRLEIDGARIALVGVRFVIDEILLVAVDLAGRPLLRDRHAVRTPYADPAGVADQIALLVEGARLALAVQGASAVRLVVVVPAPVRQPDETIPVAIDLGWRDVDLAALLGERVGGFALGIGIINDANAAAYAEFAELQALPGGEATTDVVYLKADTGIGGGAVVGGRLLTGVDGIAFEPGHVVVVPGGAACECGKRGCLVTVAGPDVVIERAGLAHERARSGLPAAVAELVRRERAGD